VTTNAGHFKHMLKCGKGNGCFKVSEIVVLAPRK